MNNKTNFFQDLRHLGVFLPMKPRCLYWKKAAILFFFLALQEGMVDYYGWEDMYYSSTLKKYRDKIAPLQNCSLGVVSDNA